MISIDDHDTIGAAFDEAAQRYQDLPFIAAPANALRDYHPAGIELSFRNAHEEVRHLQDAYSSAGLSAGHRVALMLDSRPEQLLHKLALNSLGACIVPLNPDYRSNELRHVLDHSNADLIVALPGRRPQVEAAFGAGARPRPVCLAENGRLSIPRVQASPRRSAVAPDTPASILYTSGTTGRPKGCVLSHRYELASGAAYIARGGLAKIHEGRDRIYNPLPLFHVNSSILSFHCALLSGNCQIQTDRFSPARWWNEVSASRASIVHYLGVIAPLLMAREFDPAERSHEVRFGFGAGIDPMLHAAFEARFGFPMLELWGMTEMVRVLVDCEPPRQVGTRAFGRAVPGVEVRVVDERDQPVAAHVPGEMLIRHSEASPRRDFFSGYLDDAAATEEAWAGGWFHTGDIVSQDETGGLHFVDRRKNIIRRSGENVAAAEVEGVLQSHPMVQQAAVLGVPDEIREEEVLACIVLREGAAAESLEACQQSLMAHCQAHLAYFKVPGWLYFTDSLPTTGTQKIQKHALFPAGVDPRSLEGMIDLRTFKRR